MRGVLALSLFPGRQANGTSLVIFKVGWTLTEWAAGMKLKSLTCATSASLPPSLTPWSLFFFSHSLFSPSLSHYSFSSFPLSHLSLLSSLPQLLSRSYHH